MVSDNDFLDLQDRFNALKLTVDTLLQNGLNPMLVVPGTLRFGTNEMQVGHYGIQVLSHAAGKTAFFFFDDDFQPNPNTPTNPSTTPYAAVIGGADRLNASPYSTLSLDSFAATATSELSVISRDAANDHAKTQSYVNVGANIGTVAHDMDGGRTFAQLILSNTVLELASFSSAPGTLNNGDVWYDSTANKGYLRAGGVSVELAGGSSVGVITDPRHWIDGGGYEFWFVFGNSDLITASSATNLSGLDSYGWTITSLASTEGGAGDFLSTADNDPARIVTDASADLLSSPRVFGSGAHALMAEQLLGAAPTTLSAEFYARFATASANETTSYIGFTGSATTDAAAGESVGAIVSDGTNFRLRSTTGNDAGAAIDTSWHKWKITIGASTTEWFIDDVSQGTITTSTDLFPTCFRMRAGTTNRPELAWVRVFYA